jgi:alcohol dehydrogenase
MKALVYNGPNKLAFEERVKPKLMDSTDAIVKILKTTICGTDLHIKKGDLPEVEVGRILGHEGVGVIDQVGESVTNFRIGDRVIISCISNCGKCENCRRGMYSHCQKGGWILGNTIDGTQAEFTRIPFADNSLIALPDSLNEEACVMLSDILPTGYECGVLNGQIKPGDTVAIVGAGPVGLATLLTAQFYSPAEIIMTDVDPFRLEIAKSLGATTVIDNTDGKAADVILKMTHQRGVDVAIEAIGVPKGFDICQNIVAVGGRIANIGVHGKPVQLNLEQLWSKNITLTTRLVDTQTSPLLLKTVAAEKLQPQKLITHHFSLNEILTAYETFENASKENALKVIIENAP